MEAQKHYTKVTEQRLRTNRTREASCTVYINFAVDRFYCTSTKDLGFWGLNYYNFLAADLRKIRLVFGHFSFAGCEFERDSLRSSFDVVGSHNPPTYSHTDGSSRSIAWRDAPSSCSNLCIFRRTEKMICRWSYIGRKISSIWTASWEDILGEAEANWTSSWCWCGASRRRWICGPCVQFP